MNKTKKIQLIFIYNADSFVINKGFDYFHKAISPKTYPCNLCRITYGNLGMKKEWENFIKKLPFKTIFLHRDELIKIYPKLKSFTPPTVFIKIDLKFRQLITFSELNKINTLKELEKFVINEINLLNLRGGGNYGKSKNILNNNMPVL